MTSNEIHIALNVLADLEEENPLLHRRLQRLLPALAQDFARAGKPLSERLLKDILIRTLENGTPLHNLFNSPDRRTRRRSYSDIAGRLNERVAPNTKMTLDEVINFGMLEAVERHAALEPFTEDFVKSRVGVATRHGHYPLVRYFIDYGANKPTMINLAIHAALSVNRSNFHVLYNIVKDYGSLYADTIETAGETYFKSDTRSSYNAYHTLRNKYKPHGDYPDEIFTGLEAWQHVTVRMSEYMRVRDMLSFEVPGVYERNRTAFRAVLALQSADRVLRFLDRWGQRSKQPLKDLIDKFDMPMAQTGIDWPAWGDALLKFGPQVGFLMHYANQVPRPVNNIHGEISLRLTRDHIWKTCYPLRHKNEDLAALCFDLGRTNDAFETALQIWTNRADYNTAPDIGIPELKIDGTRFGLPGYTLRKMSYEDMRIMFMGDYTGCCERVGDHFEETVQHTVETRESGYYVLVDDDDNIRLHSWVWRGEGGQLVIDGYESKDPAIQTSHLVALSSEIAQTLAKPSYRDYGITDIMIGISGQRFSPQASFPEAYEVTPRFACTWYFPDACQWLVKRIVAPTVFEKAHDDSPKKPQPR